MKTTQAWGSQVELRAIFSLLKSPIEIYCADAPTVLMGENFGEKVPMKLAYHKHEYTMGEHYNSLVPNSS